MSENLLLDKKDIRILWNTDDNGNITELIVAKFTEEDNPQYLYKKYSSDVGNCLAGWDNWLISDILFSIFIQHGSIDAKSRIKNFRELLKIKEVYEDQKNSIGVIEMFPDLFEG